MDLLSLFDGLVSADAGSKFRLFNDGVDAYKCLSCENKNIQPIMKYIDNSVNTDKTDVKVLELMSNLIQQCSAEVLIGNLEKWVINIRKVLRNDTRQYVKTWAAEMLCELLGQAAKIPELHRKVSLKLIPKLMQELTVIVSELPLIFLLCLQTYMQHYAGSCGAFRKQIEQSLLTFVGREEKSIVCLAASCYSLLPTIGSGGNQNTIHVDNWQKQMSVLTATLSQCLNCLFTDAESENTPTGNKDVLSLPNLENLDSANRFSGYYLRARSLCMFIAAMLEEPMPFSVNIPLESVLSIVIRILSLNICDLIQSKNTDSILLTSIMPSLQMEALHILNLLLSKVQQLILPRANTINTIFSKILKWARWNTEAHFELEKPLNNLRIAIYKVLKSWILLRGNMPSSNNCDDNFVVHLLKEITPEVHTVQLNLDDAVTEKRLHGRKKTKVKPIVKTHITPIRKIDRTANCYVCIEALKALRVLVHSIGPTLKQETIKTLRDKVVSLVCEMQQKVLRYDIPYDDVNCRKGLYKLLLAVTIVPHAHCPPPIQCAVACFSRGRQDRDEKVKYVCIEAAAVCGTMVCPLMPPMFFVPPVAPASVPHPSDAPMDIDTFGLVEDDVHIITHTISKDTSTSTEAVEKDSKCTQTETNVTEELESCTDKVEVIDVAQSTASDEEVTDKDDDVTFICGSADDGKCIGGETIPREEPTDKSLEPITPDDDLKIVFEDPGVPWEHSSEESCSILDDDRQVVVNSKTADEGPTRPMAEVQVMETEEASGEIQEMIHSFVDSAPD